MVQRRPLQSAAKWFPNSPVQNWSISNAGDWCTFSMLQGTTLSWLAIQGGAALSASCDLEVDISKKYHVRSVATLPDGASSSSNAAVGVVSFVYNADLSERPLMIYVRMQRAGVASIHIVDFEPTLELLTSYEIRKMIGDKKSASVEDLRAGALWQWTPGRLVVLINGNNKEGILVLCQVRCEGGIGLSALDKVVVADSRNIYLTPRGLCGADGSPLEGTLGWLQAASDYSGIKSDPMVFASLQPFIHAVAALPSPTFLMPVINHDGILEAIDLIIVDEGNHNTAADHADVGLNTNPIAVLREPVSTRAYLGDLLKSAFAPEGVLLSYFPWFLELSEETSAPTELSRDAAAQLWPIFTEVAAAADDWRYADSNATQLLDMLLLLAQPVDAQTTTQSIAHLSGALEMPAWCFRSFLIMRGMLPPIYLQVLSWYTLYLRIPKDVLFHPSVPPLSTLLHPEVDIAALQNTIAVVLSNVQEPTTAERLLRGVLDHNASPEVSKAMLGSWWELMYPMELDPVVLLYSVISGARIQSTDESRLINAAATLMQRLVVDQIMLPKIESGIDWASYCATEAPFKSARRSSDIIAALLRISDMCSADRISAVYDNAEAIAIPPSVQYVADLLHLVHSCCMLVAMSGLDEEEQELVASYYMREILFSSRVASIYRNLMSSDEVLSFVMGPVPHLSADKEVTSGGKNGWDSDIEDTSSRKAYRPLLGELCLVCCEPPAQPTSLYIKRIVECVVKAYIDHESIEGGEATPLRAEYSSSSGDSEDRGSSSKRGLGTEGFDLLLSVAKTSPPLQQLLSECIRRQKPPTALISKIMSNAQRLIGESHMTTQWRLTLGIHSASLLTSPAHHSVILDTIITPFDVAHYILSSWDRSIVLVAVGVLCETINYTETHGIEAKLAKLCALLQQSNLDGALRLMVVTVCTTLQKASETLGENDNLFYIDLLLWRINKYIGMDSNEAHRILEGNQTDATTVILAACEALEIPKGHAMAHWLYSDILPELLKSSNTTEVDVQRGLAEAEELQTDARAALVEREVLERFHMWQEYSTGLLGAWAIDAHGVAEEWLLAERRMLMAELWERRNLVWTCEYIRYQESTWMLTVGHLWREISLGRKAIEDEEDLQGRDEIAAQFALEDLKLQAKSNKGDLSSTDDEWSDWDNTDEPEVVAQRTFVSNRESIRTVLKDLGIK